MCSLQNMVHYGTQIIIITNISTNDMAKFNVGKYGPQYSQFTHKAKEAIKFAYRKEKMVINII